MSIFQILGLAVFGLLIAANLHGFLRHPSMRAAALAWIVLAALGATAMIAPDATTRIARTVGIQRGADLVLYSGVLAGIAVSFLFYARMRRTDRAITLLVRRLALEDVRPTSTDPSGDDGDPHGSELGNDELAPGEVT